MFFKLFCWPLEENIKYKDFACFHENTNNSETCTESHITVLLRLIISVIGRVYPRDLLLLDRRKVGGNRHVMGGFQFSESQAGSGASFTVRGRFLNVAKSSLKRVTGRTFKISKCFQRSK
jgi:hypothetical protein